MPSDASSHLFPLLIVSTSNRIFVGYRSLNRDIPACLGLARIPSYLGCGINIWDKRYENCCRRDCDVCEEYLVFCYSTFTCCSDRNLHCFWEFHKGDNLIVVSCMLDVFALRDEDPNGLMLRKSQKCNIDLFSLSNLHSFHTKNNKIWDYNVICARVSPFNPQQVSRILAWASCLWGPYFLIAYNFC